MKSTLTILAVALMVSVASAGTLAVHFDAAQIPGSLSDGADVVIWNDLAPYWGVNNAVQTVGITGSVWPLSNAPQFVASSTANGLPGVHFSRTPDENGSQEGLCLDNIYTSGWIDSAWGEWYNKGGVPHHSEPAQYTSDWNAAGTMASATVIGVLYVDEAGGSGSFVDFAPYGVGSNYGYGDEDIYDSFGSNAEVMVADDVVGLTAPHVVIINLQADGTKTTYVNGVQMSQITVAVDFSVINPTIGCDNPLQGSSSTYGVLNNALGGTINEIQIYEGDMTVEDLMVINGDLMAKYDIPEPATLAMLALGGLALIRRRK